MEDFSSMSLCILHDNNASVILGLINYSCAHWPTGLLDSVGSMHLDAQFGTGACVSSGI